MILSNTGILCLSFLIGFSLMIQNFVQIITCKDCNQSVIPVNDKEIEIMNNSVGNLIWFLQISDIHISIFQDESRISEFYNFCNETVDAIKPSLVIASGDLTDAKDKNELGSQQYEKEWLHYWNTLRDTHITNRTVWLDVRGNHGTPRGEHPHNGNQPREH